MQHNANILQGSHFLFKFSVTVMQINKIDLTLTSNLTLMLSSNTNPVLNTKPDPNHNLKLSCKKREKQLRNIIVSLLRYVILLKSRYLILDWHLFCEQVIFLLWYVARSLLLFYLCDVVFFANHFLSWKLSTEGLRNKIIIITFKNNYFSYFSVRLVCYCCHLHFV